MISLQFDYTDRDALAELVLRLLDGKGQFAISPFPQDLKDASRTGWVVSYPDESRAIVPLPEADNVPVPPDPSPVAA